LVDIYRYTVTGLMKEQILSGIKTNFEYHNNGNQKKVTDGRGNSVAHQNYKQGVARRVIMPNSGQINRVVSNYGNITSETIDIDVNSGRKSSTSYEYNDPFSRLTKTNRPAGRHPIVVSNPIMRGASEQHYRQTTVGSLRTEEYLDGFGRVRFSTMGDTSGNDLRKQAYQFDSQGNATFSSDLVAGNANSNHGHRVEYDFLGRPTKSFHTQDAANGIGAVETCYGARCSNQPGFSGKTPLKNGYATKDQKGFLTFYETRAFGNPANSQLMEVRQQIGSGPGGEEVVTTMTRRVYSNLRPPHHRWTTHTVVWFRDASRIWYSYGAQLR